MNKQTTLLISLQLEKDIFFFTQDSTIGIPNHLHILINKKDEMLFVCCTSQEDTMNRLIKYRKLPESSIVWIKKDKENGLKKDDSFVNCNNIFSCAKDQFADLIKQNKIRKTLGNISESHFEQIKIGLNDSPLVSDEIKDLFNINQIP